MKRPKGLSRLDYVKVKPIRRGKRRLKNCKILRLLSVIHWDLVVSEGPGAVKKALHEARYHGEYWHGLTPKGDGGLVDYCEYVVSAAKRVKVINDIEWKLWFSNPKDDPRLLEFKRGFLKAKKEAKEEKRAKMTKKETEEESQKRKAKLIDDLNKIFNSRKAKKGKRKK
jgi:hypothetical protein